MTNILGIPSIFLGRLLSADQSEPFILRTNWGCQWPPPPWIKPPNVLHVNMRSGILNS